MNSKQRRRARRLRDEVAALQAELGEIERSVARAELEEWIVASMRKEVLRMWLARHPLLRDIAHEIERARRRQHLQVVP